MALPTDLDLFGDGSCVELINFDGDIITANGTTMTVVQDAGATPHTFSNGAYGQGVSFDSLTGISSTTPLGQVVGANATDGFTVSIWFKENAPSQGNEEFLDVFVNGGIKTELYAYTANELYAYSSGEIHTTIPNAWSSADLSVWHHIIMTSQGYDGTGTSVSEIYVDGVLRDTSFTTARKTAIENRLDINVFAGAVNSGGVAREYDQCRIFNRYINATEAAILYNELSTLTPITCGSSESLLDVLSDGSCVELLRFNSNLNSFSHGALTPLITPTFTTGKFSTTAVQMTSTLSLFGLSSLQLAPLKTSPSSLSFFVNISSANAGDIVLLKYGNIHYGDVLVKYIKSSNTVEATMGTSVASSTVSLDVFSHIVVGNDSANLYLSIDGVTTSTAFTTRDANSIRGLYVGDGDYVLDQMRLFDRALNANDIILLSLENDCYFTQSSFMGNHAKIFIQNSTNESLNASPFSQSDTVNILNSLSFSQKETANAINSQTFSQSSTNVPGNLVLGRFAQHSRVHEYHPYVDISNDFTFNNDTISDLFTFDGTATSTNYNYTLASTEPLSFQAGKIGQGIYANGTSVGTIDSVSYGAKWYSVWLSFGEFSNVSSDIYIIKPTTAITYALNIYIDTAARLNIKIGDNINVAAHYTSLPNEYANVPIQIIASNKTDGMRILINNFVVLETTTGGLNASGLSSMQFWGAGFVGVIDQFRYGNTLLTPITERAITWDSISKSDFNQKSTTPNYTAMGLMQQSNIGAYTDAGIAQSSSNITGSSKIFTQKSSLFSESLYKTMSQVQTLGDDVHSVMISRVVA